MNLTRANSLSKVFLPQWRWSPILDYLINSLSFMDLHELPIPKEFLEKQTVYGVKDKAINVKTITWGCKTGKFEKIRAACVDAGSMASVINLVLQPSPSYEMPFFGADFVTLPSGHLLALDLQPVLKEDCIHNQYIIERLMPIHDKWQSLLPPGGGIPDEAKSFFSPGFLWTRLPLGTKSDILIREVIYPAFKDYLDLYLELANASKLVSKDRTHSLKQGQNLYLEYRSKKDPARAMLTRFYGRDWTEHYIQNVLFNLLK